MASFIEITPLAHATKVTRLVRIDNDFKVTVSVDDDGTLSHHYFNFTGIPDEFTYRPDPPDANLLEARLAKDGTDEDLVTRINMFYNATDNALEAWQIPQPWIYGEPITKDAYLPGKLPELVSQSFPLVIWNTLKDTQTAPGANTASALTFERRYAQLSTIAERRTFLKNQIHTLATDEMLPLLAMGSGIPVLAFESTREFPVEYVYPFARRMQSYMYWLEMLTRAISVDTNLGTEAKFNLLAGESGLKITDIVPRLPLTLAAAIAPQAAYTQWRFQRFGSVGSNTPWPYTAPSTDPGTWVAVRDTAMEIGASVPAAVTENWFHWLRSG